MPFDKFSLKWEEFCNNAASSFQRLLEDTDFTDVTLASSDGQFVRAHKVVLSFCSPVLKSMLVKSRHASPLLYLRGVKLSQLETLMTFCYMGQAEVLHSDLEEFLEVARDLGIRGLGQEGTKQQNQEQDQITSRNKKLFEINYKNAKIIDSEIGKTIIKTEIIKREALENNVDSSKAIGFESSELLRTESITDEMSETNNEEKYSATTDECTLCNKSFSTKYALSRHIKEKHTKCVRTDPRIIELSKPNQKENYITLCDECTLCGKSFSTKYALGRHIKEKHTDGITFSCSNCDWTGTREYLLATHMKLSHSEQSFTVWK